MFPRKLTSRAETFSRVIVKKHVALLNKQSSAHSYVSQRELQSAAVQCTLKETLTRPITMMFTEPIILFTGIYLAFAYGLIFFCFQAYPIIFEGTYPLVLPLSRERTNELCALRCTCEGLLTLATQVPTVSMSSKHRCAIYPVSAHREETVMNSH